MNWKILDENVKNCRRCALRENCTRVLSGYGCRNADIMFVAEAPGKKEDEIGIPFVGRSGRVFDILLASAGLKREDIYITNIVKCHPENNKTPSQSSIDRCMPLLRGEFFLVQPKLTVCLGRVAAQNIIDRNFIITKQHGIIYEKNDCSFLGTFHPSFLLRNPDKTDLVKSDFSVISEYIDTLRHI